MKWFLPCVTLVGFLVPVLVIYNLKFESRALGGAIRRMLNRKFAIAWEKWQQVFADQKFATRMGGGAILLCINYA